MAATARRKTAVGAEPTPIPGAPYALAPGLDPANYKVTASLSECGSWEAWTHDGQGDDLPGRFAKVGYVWIGLDADLIIPVSRGDEHHLGADTLHRLTRKRGAGKLQVDLSRFLPVWMHGNNYGYGVAELPDWVAVMRKALAWGMPDGKFSGFNDLDGVMVTVRKLVELNGDVVPRKGRIAPLGLELIEALEAVSRELSPPPGETGKGERPSAAAKAASHRLVEVYAGIDRGMPGVVFGENHVPALRSALRKEVLEGDVSALGLAWFGFGSMKRELHERLRRLMGRRKRGESGFDDRDLARFWGDLAAAEARLAAI